MRKETRYIIIIALFAILLLPSTMAVTTLQSTLSKYDPLPATPGQTVHVWLLIQNTGDSEARNVNIELIPQYPFSIYKNSATKKVQILGAHNDYLIDYVLKVDDNAIQGDNTIKLRYGEEGSDILEDELTLTVKSRDATLNINAVKVTPSEISPGSDGEVTISVKNTAPNTITDITLKLYLQAQVGSTIVDLPFAPIDSNAEKKIFKLDPGQTSDFSYNLRVYPDAIAKVYKIPFTLTYYDSLGTQINKTDYIGVVVNSAPEITVYVDKTDLLKQKKAGTVTLKVINKGLNDVKFLNVLLEKTEKYDILSNSESTYVGNLVSDDYQSVDYIIDINSEDDNILLPITLQYRDSNNKYYEKTVDVSLRLLDSEKLSSASQGTGTSIAMVLVIIVVIGIGVWIFLKKRKTSKKGQF
jgi:hypothetical protein